jgi:drug/metabolite transporter (DMT)-like permease
MGPSAVALVLVAAVLHATWNALAHAVDDKLMAFVLIDIAFIGCAIAMISVSPLPAAGAWPFIVLSGALQTAYQFCLVQAYRLGDFGQMYPLARGTSPWVVAVLSVVVLGRPMPVAELVGVLTLSAGLVVLIGANGVPGRRQLPALGAALATGVLIACYTVCDGTGVVRSGSVLGYIGWMSLCSGILLPLFAIAKRRRAFWPALRRPGWKMGLTGGVLSVVAYGLVVWAQDLEPDSLPGISALRETSIIIAAAISAFHFRESFGRIRILASTTVLIGILMMELR